MSVKLNFDDLKRLKPETPAEATYAPAETVLAIVRVRQAGYVPDGVHVRSRVDQEIFTAEIPAGMVSCLREDERVVAVEVSKHLESL